MWVLVALRLSKFETAYILIYYFNASVSRLDWTTITKDAMLGLSEGIKSNTSIVTLR